MSRASRFAWISLALILGGRSSLSADQVALAWTRQFGSADRDAGIGLGINAQGNVQVVSSVGGAIVGGMSQLADAFVTTFDVLGNNLQTLKLGAAADEFYEGAAFDEQGNIYLAGSAGYLSNNQDAFLNKYDPTGATLWKRQLGTPQTEFSVKPSLNNLGDAFVGGGTFGTLQGLSAGDEDAFVSRYDTGGNLQWTRQLGSSAEDRVHASAADAFGNVFITGPTSGNLAGVLGGFSDVFVSKLSHSGEILWSTQLGTNQSENALGASTDAEGNVYITGQTFGNLSAPLNGSGDLFLSKFSPTGALLWTTQLGSSGLDVPKSIATDSLGNSFIAGWTDGNFGGTNAGAYDAFVTKVNSTGGLLWTKQFGSNGYDNVHALSIDGSGSVYMTGMTDGAFGGTNSGGVDVFVAKLVEVPEPTSSGLVSIVVTAAMCFLRNRLY